MSIRTELTDLLCKVTESEKVKHHKDTRVVLDSRLMSCVAMLLAA